MVNPVQPTQQRQFAGPRGGGSADSYVNQGIDPTLAQLLQYIQSDELLTKKLAAEKELANIQGNFGLEQQGLANQGLITAENIRAKSLETQQGLANQGAMDLQNDAQAHAFEMQKWAMIANKLSADGDVVGAAEQRAGLAAVDEGLRNGYLPGQAMTYPGSSLTLDLEQRAAGVVQTARDVISKMAQVGIEGENTKAQAEALSEISNAILEQEDQLTNETQMIEGNAAFIVSNLKSRGISGFKVGSEEQWRKMLDTAEKDGLSIFSEGEKALFIETGRLTGWGSKPLTATGAKALSAMAEETGAGRKSVGELAETFRLVAKQLHQGATSQGMAPDVAAVRAEGEVAFANAFDQIGGVLGSAPGGDYYPTLKGKLDHAKKMKVAGPSGAFNLDLIQADMSLFVGTPQGQAFLKKTAQEFGVPLRVINKNIQSFIEAPEVNPQIREMMGETLASYVASGEDDLAQFERSVNTIAQEGAFTIEQSIFADREYRRLNKQLADAEDALSMAQSSGKEAAPLIDLAKNRFNRAVSSMDTFKAKYGEFLDTDPYEAKFRVQKKIDELQVGYADSQNNKRTQDLARKLASQSAGQQPQTNPAGPVVEETRKFAQPDVASAPMPTRPIQSKGGLMQSPQTREGYGSLDQILGGN